MRTDGPRVGFFFEGRTSAALPGDSDLATKKMLQIPRTSTPFTRWGITVSAHLAAIPANGIQVL